MDKPTYEQLTEDLAAWIACARRWELKAIGYAACVASQEATPHLPQPCPSCAAALAAQRKAEADLAALRAIQSMLSARHVADDNARRRMMQDAIGAKEAQRKAEQERDCWLETAREESRNRDYYRGLVQQIGGMFGVAARTQDDGGIVEDVLCAKVPELVEALKREANEANGMLQAIADEHRQIDVGMSLQDAALLVAARVKKSEQERDTWKRTSDTLKTGLRAQIDTTTAALRECEQMRAVVELSAKVAPTDTGHGLVNYDRNNSQDENRLVSQWFDAVAAYRNAALPACPGPSHPDPRDPEVEQPPAYSPQVTCGEIYGSDDSQCQRAPLHDGPHDDKPPPQRTCRDCADCHKCEGFKQGARVESDSVCSYFKPTPPPCESRSVRTCETVQCKRCKNFVHFDRDRCNAGHDVRTGQIVCCDFSLSERAKPETQSVRGWANLTDMGHASRPFVVSKDYCDDAPGEVPVTVTWQRPVAEKEGA